MDDRIGLNSSEARELKLGTTFSSHHNAFHTLKYDFKPASVDLNKEATVDVGSNNQVQVTVPHLDGSGVPKTVFKGNQKKYTKECVLIIDKTTGECTLERLTNNISVKKTRSETAMKSNGGQLGSGGAAGGGVSSASSSTSATAPLKLSENSTQRTISKTKVSTGVRKTNSIGFLSKPSPGQGSPNYHNHHKSPQSAPAWNANNGQSTLPSIPMIDDDEMPMSGSSSVPMAPIVQEHNNMALQQHNHHHNHHQNHLPPQHHSQPVPTIGVAEIMSSSDSSSESSYSSDSDSSTHCTTNNNNNNVKPPPTANLLKEDLCLSDSNSDSD